MSQRIPWQHPQGGVSTVRILPRKIGGGHGASGHRESAARSEWYWGGISVPQTPSARGRTWRQGVPADLCRCGLRHRAKARSGSRGTRSLRPARQCTCRITCEASGFEILGLPPTDSPALQNQNDPRWVAEVVGIPKIVRYTKHVARARSWGCYWRDAHLTAIYSSLATIMSCVTILEG